MSLHYQLFKAPNCTSELSFSEIKDIIETFGSHLNIDLQQRGVEFAQLFGSHSHLRESLLEKMPAMTINKMNGNGDVEVTEIHVPTEKLTTNGRSNTDTLLDLLGTSDDIIMSSSSMVVPTNTAPAATSNLLDLLGDIDLSSVPAAPVLMSNNNNNNLTSPITMSILDDNENSKIPDGSVFGLNGGSAPGNYDLGLDFLTPSTTTTAKIVTAYDKNDLLVQLATVNQSDHMQIVMTTTNNSMDTLEQYLFQVS